MSTPSAVPTNSSQAPWRLRRALSRASTASTAKNGGDDGFQADCAATIAAGEIAYSPAATSAGHNPNQRRPSTNTMPTAAELSSAISTASAAGSSHITDIGSASK